MSMPSQARAVEWNKVWCSVGLGARGCKAVQGGARSAFRRMVQLDSPKILDILDWPLSEVCRISVLRQVNEAMQKIAWPVFPS